MELSDFESLNTKRKLSFQIDHRTVRVPNRECCTVNRTEEKYRGASCTTVNRFTLIVNTYMTRNGGKKLCNVGKNS